MLWYGRSLGLLLVLLVSLLLSSCGKIPSFLSGGGPNVAANTQVGENNSQTLGVTNNVSPKVTIRPKSKVETIDQSVETVTNHELPPWVWVVGMLLFIVGWVTDTPATYARHLLRR